MDLAHLFDAAACTGLTLVVGLLWPGVGHATEPPAGQSPEDLVLPSSPGKRISLFSDLAVRANPTGFAPFVGGATRWDYALGSSPLFRGLYTKDVATIANLARLIRRVVPSHTRRKVNAASRGSKVLRRARRSC